MKRRITWLILVTLVWGSCVSVYAQTGAPLVWGVNTAGSIFRWTGSTWQQMPGKLSNVSVGADGTVWGVNAAGNIFRWTGDQWQQVPGGLVQISVGSAQHVWGVNAANVILRWTGSTWQQMPGKLSNVSVGADGTVWGVNAAGNIFRWTGDQWQQVPGGLVQISVGSAQHVWGVNAANDIWRWTGSTWQQMPGKLSNVSVGADGTVWGVNAAGNIFRWTGDQWQQVPGGLVQIAVASPASVPVGVSPVTPTPTATISVPLSSNIIISSPPQAPPGPPSATTGSLVVSPPLVPGTSSSQPLTVSGVKWQPSKVPPASGSIVCSRGDTNTCGTTKADYVGPYSLNMKCDSGFYDPIYGGTCWKCPDDTDGGGAWIRSATKVTDDDACWRVPKEQTTKATKVKGPPALAWDCPSDTFWDGYPFGGACWQCPATHPRRTLAPVYADNACATPLNETRPAVFLTFNGCPKPDAVKMGLSGKRLPGKPFLDIAGGWSQGVAAGGCYACPVTDENGDILITARNAAPIYGDNQGCDILFRWKPHPFPEPGLSGLAGVKEAVVQSKLLDSAGLTAGLFLLAESRGMAKDTPAAKDWVAAQWRDIAAGPYKNEAFRSLVFLRLLLVAKAPPAERTSGDTELLKAFEGYINARRVYLAQMALAMYDAWKAHDDATKQSYRRSQLQVMFDFGTVPLDFHGTLGATMALGATGVGVIGAIAAAEGIAASVEWVRGGAGVWTATRSTTLYGTLGSMRALDILKFANVTANLAMAGAAIITVAGVILQSIAIEQFIAIISARPKLEAALEQAKRPVTLNEILAQPNGSDQAVYFWAKAMDVPSETEDPQLVALAAAAHQQAQASGYQLQVASGQ